LPTNPTPLNFVHNISRRSALKLVTAGTLLGLSTAPHRSLAAITSSGATADPWARTHNRVWLGGDFWANPMEDWHIVDGAAECLSMDTNRSIHSITHQLTNPAGRLKMSVRLSQLDANGKNGGAGFRLGIRSELNEYRSNCFVGTGLNAGIVDGQLQLGPESTRLSASADLTAIDLHLTGEGQNGKMRLTLEARSPQDGSTLGRISHVAAASKLLGNIAVVSNYANSIPRNNRGQPDTEAGSRHRFAHWTFSGTAFTVTPERRFGPILWSMYSLSDSRTPEGFVMKISALTGPMGPQDSPVVELHVQRDRQWTNLGAARLDSDAWVATFRIPNWNEQADTPFKLVYREQHLDGTETPDEWTGTIRANPTGRPLRMAALTCQNDYGFPYEPVANNIVKMNPDLALFSGDQIYESHGGFGIIREPYDRATLNYLRKYYQFGWAFREAMRHQPTLCLPDDHDVFQGNIWGEAGAPMTDQDSGASSKGGYIEPARMVNAVHRTTVAHHPDAFDPTPVLQGISVYYGDMVYGDVSFAIIGDRQWKSGPTRVETGSGRADHVADPDFDCAALDQPGLVLLGERQEAFLKQWATDWRGHKLKSLLSQTVFAGVATHHGRPDGYLKGDLDSGAWPQTARDRAIDILRPSMALHINGDQHLTTLAQYGTAHQRDANWSFCTPAISAGYPRWWLPDDVGMPHANRPRHGHAHTGEFLDGFGNKVYVYAVGNPDVGKAPNRYDKAHQKGSGFGFVTFDTKAKTYHVESFRFLIDPLDGNPTNQFPGWPMTIQQQENRGKNRIS